MYRVHTWLGSAHARLADAGGRAAALLRGLSGDRRGQGTVEYVALVLLIALVMFGVITAMKSYEFSGGQQLGDVIVNKIKEAVGKVRY